MAVRSRSRASSVEQEGVAVLADRAQLVEVGVEAGRDHAAIAQQHGRLVGNGAREQVADLGRRRQRLVHRVEQRAARSRHARAQRGQAGERGAQAREFARAHLAQRDARVDALDVRDAAQRLAQRLDRARLAQRVDRVVPLRGDAALAQRPRQPLAQRAAAHAARAGVEQRQQRRRVLAAQRLRQLEVALRRRRQVDQFARALDLQRLHVRQRLALRVLGVGEQRRGGGLRRLAVPAR